MIQNNIRIVKRKIRDSEKKYLQMFDAENECKKYTLKIRQEKKKKKEKYYRGQN
jgi:hypothetical protein